MSGLKEIVGRYGQALGRVASSYEADPMLQEDLLQDILLAIHQALPKLINTESLAPFVFRIAHNRGVSHVVRQLSVKRGDQDGAQEPEAINPEVMLATSERSRRLAAAIRQLPVPYRQVITLLLEGLSYADIAETLGLSVSNVGVRVNRGKARLKEMLDGA